MSWHRQDRHQLITYNQKLSKDMDKLDYRLGFVRGKRWRQVKKAEDERLLKNTKQTIK